MDVNNVKGPNITTVVLYCAHNVGTKSMKRSTIGGISQHSVIAHVAVINVVEDSGVSFVCTH